MNLFDAIYKEFPDFSGLVIRESDAEIHKIQKIGVSMAWKINRYRAKEFSKVMIINSDREYFIADLLDVVTIAGLSKLGNFKEAIQYQEELYGTWITDRLNGKSNDNALEERCAIVFEKPSEIKKIKTGFVFNRTSIYYVYKKNEPLKSLGEYLEIENFGKIGIAKIKINGLTVIAGENDTGKSTAGKVLFSLIKGVSRYKQDLKESREHRVTDLISELYNLLRRNISFHLMREVFHPNNFFGNIKVQNIDIITTEINDDIDGLFDYKKVILTEHINNKEVLKNSIDILNKIKNTILIDEDKKEQIQRALSKVIFSEFLNDVSPKGLRKKTKISYFAGENNLINVEIEKDKITSLQFNDDLSYKDVIFIETPLLMQLYDLIQFADVVFEDSNKRDRFLNSRPKVALHIKDLVNKLSEAKYFSERLFFENDFDSMNLIKAIYSIIGGNYSFNRDTNELEFVNNKKQKIKALNTASGIKSFGLIQLLLQADVINTKSLLVIDEPENHLHPEWQLKYAEIIIELVKANIPVIITSHSPYMINALQYYSEKENLQERSSYYFAKQNKENLQSNLIDATNDLNMIFASLSKPFTDLVWE